MHRYTSSTKGNLYDCINKKKNSIRRALVKKIMSEVSVGSRISHLVKNSGIIHKILN